MFNYYLKNIKRQLGSLKSSGQERNSTYHSIGLINPAVGTSNLGDYIIEDAVKWHLRDIFGESLLTSYPSHLATDLITKRMIAGNDYVFVGGTNLLSSQMDKYNQWKIGPADKIILKNKPTLMGVGWWQYQDAPNGYTRKLLQTVLNNEGLHSVRDSYTRNMLNGIGIKNVLNTCCPTTWNLTEDVCAAIPRKKANQVLTTLTFYKANEKSDTELLNILLDNYDVVHLWIQGLRDFDYLQKLDIDSKRISLIPPSLEAFNKALDKPDLEYIGTRLHAGIRALQKGKRTMILAVDNRALEISKDTNLNVIPVVKVDAVKSYITEEYVTKINLPETEIKRWKEQFSK